MDQVLNDEEIEIILGNNLKELRLQKNIPRHELCERAGVSMNALRNLESGTGTTLKTLIKVVRALGRQDWLTAMAPQATINPLYMVKEKPTRERARRSKKRE